MRCTFLVMAALMFATFTAAATRADPGDQGNLKLWVQAPGSASMLHDLLGNDSRFHPILRVDMNGFGTTPACGVIPSDAHANCTAEFIFHMAEMVIGSADPNGLAIQLGGFGQGGRPDSGPGWGNALALARPPDRDVNSPLSTDFTLAPNGANGQISHLTPWFDFGTQDCSHWMRTFAAHYKSLVQASHPNTEAYFQPTRFVFDLEFSSGLGGSLQFADADTIRNFTINPVGQGQTDTRSFTNPIFGFPNNIASGRTLDELNTDYFVNTRRWPCDGCDNSNREAWEKMLWVNNVNAQAQLAALNRSLTLNFDTPANPMPQDSAKSILESMSPAAPNPQHRALRYTQFNEIGTDGLLNPNFPPYDWNGQPLRKVGYRDANFYNTATPNLNYTATNLVADFGSSVFYAFPRALNGRLLQGQSNEDWVIQDARERLESSLFTRINHGGDLPPFWLTPWIAGVNQYFVNMDFHRRLLALCRAKEWHATP